MLEGASVVVPKSHTSCSVLVRNGSVKVILMASPDPGGYSAYDRNVRQKQK
jgi:hypothetical protein